MARARPTAAIRQAAASLKTLALLSCLALPALGQGNEADAHFKRGTAAFNKGDYQAAAAEFDEADRLSPHGVAKYSAGIAWQSAAQPARAADLLSAALASGQLDANQKADAEKRMRQLSTSLGRARISAPPGSRVSVAHLHDAAPPVDVFLAPGRHSVVAVQEDGRRLTAQVEILRGQTESVELSAESKKAAPEPKQSPETPLPKAGAAEAPSSSGKTQRTLGWVAVGGSAVAVGAAGLFWWRANAARDDFYDSKFRDVDARGRADSMRTATNVAWVCSGVLAATGITLLLTAPKPSEQPERAAWSLSLGPEQASVRVRY